jgi:DNA polymerase-3 subunit alpha
MEIPEPPVPVCDEWDPFDKLAREKEVVGVYLSGHPLDEFKVQLDQFCTPGGLSNLEDMVAARGRTISFGGMVTEAEHKIGKNGRPWGGMTVEDYHGSQRMMFWRDDYLKFREYMVSGWFLFIKGKVQMKQFRGADELEFKVTRIELPHQSTVQPGQVGQWIGGASVRLDRVQSRRGRGHSRVAPS